MKVLWLVIVFAGSAFAQGKFTEGFEMSAMTYDSLGLRVMVDESGSHGRNSFERYLRESCVEVLRANGIRAAVLRSGESLKGFPTVLIDLTIVPIRSGGLLTDELFYGTIAFNREVTFTVAGRPMKGAASTWSAAIGGQSRSRLMVLAEVQERLKDFLVDYLKLNSMRGERAWGLGERE